MHNNFMWASALRRRTRQPISYGYIPEWQDDALCLGFDPDLWFPEWPKPNEYSLARRICKLCPVREQCLEYALKIDARHGMFGGLTPGERKNLKTQRSEQIPS